MARVPSPVPGESRLPNSPGNRVVRLAGRPAIWIFVLAMLVRGTVTLVQLHHFDSDPDAYRSIAETLARSGVFGLTASSGDVVATAFRPPLYPFLLSWLAGDPQGTINNLPIAILHVLLGSLTATGTFLATTRWLGEDRGRVAGIVAALLVIVDPILIQQSTLVMTETLATALVTLILWWWVRNVPQRLDWKFAIGLGAGLSLAYLCRPTFLVWRGMLVLAVGMSRPIPPSGRLQRLGNAALTGLVLLVAVAGWTWRNASMLGHPIWATSHGGYTLLLGNNPLIYQHLRENGPFQRWDPNAFLRAYSHRFEGDSSTENFWFQAWEPQDRVPEALAAKVSEVEDDRVAYQAAKATIERETQMFLLSCLVRVYKLWTPFPHATEGRSGWLVAAIGAYYSLLYLAAAVGVARMRRRWVCASWWPIPTLLLTLTMVHAVYWSNMRMRAPAIPAIAMLAAAALPPVNRAPVNRARVNRDDA